MQPIGTVTKSLKIHQKERFLDRFKELQESLIKGKGARVKDNELIAKFL